MYPGAIRHSHQSLTIHPQNNSGMNEILATSAEKWTTLRADKLRR